MSTQTMTQTIADYFKTQPVVKAWLIRLSCRQPAG